MPHIEQFASAWLDATEDVWDEHEPHTDTSYDAYLSWYVSRTRQFVTHATDVEEEVVPQCATVVDTYPAHRDQAQRGAVCILLR